MLLNQCLKTKTLTVSAEMDRDPLFRGVLSVGSEIDRPQEFLKRNWGELHYLVIGTQCPGNLIRERNFALCVRTAVGALVLPRNNGSAPAAFFAVC